MPHNGFQNRALGSLPKDVTRGERVAHRAEERQWEVGSGVPGICPSVNPEQRRKSIIYPGDKGGGMEVGNEGGNVKQG